MADEMQRPPELTEKPKEGWNIKPMARVMDT